MYQVYEIQLDDTLETILERFGLTEQQLRELNGEFQIISGNYLVVPKNNFDFYTVKKGDTCYQISSLYGIPVSTLTLLNGKEESDYLYEGEVLKVPKKDVEIYFTKPGDTLSLLAKNLNVSLSSIADQNENLVFLPEQMVVYQKNR